MAIIPLAIRAVILSLLLPVFLLLTGCDAPSNSTTDTGVVKNASVDASGELSADNRLKRLAKTWSGDFDGMQKRRIVRALVVYNETNFFFDEKGHPQGMSYEILNAFEKYINRARSNQEQKIIVVQIPVRRDHLLSYILNGNADIAVANLTITDERKAQVDFSTPFYSNAKEIVVTGPGSPAINKLEDLAGREVWVRESSSYYSSLLTLNQQFKQKGLTEITIRKAEEQLETEALLEMVAAGIIGITVADDYLANTWAQVLGDLRLHPDLALRNDGQIAWMFRKNSPFLKKEIDAFVAQNKQGSLLGNVLIDRYYTHNKWLKQAGSEEQLARLKNMSALFKKYAAQYDFDWLMIAAQAYQESGLDQNKVSSAGAIGVMQLLKSTANDPNVNIQDIHILKNNIHAGNKYLRFILDRYYSENKMDKLNQHLFAFASYNAGPARIARLREQAEEEGLNPDVWFQNVEIIAGREIGRETVQYVSNIFKYYVAYRMAFEQLEQRGQLKKKI